MKKIRFVVHTGYVGCDHEIEELFDDDVTDEELEEYLTDFIFERCESHWEEIEEETTN